MRVRKQTNLQPIPIITLWVRKECYQVAQAKNLLTAEAAAYLQMAYGDLNEYLKSRIEAEVRNQKMGVGTLTLNR